MPAGGHGRPDYYRILGVDRGASDRELKQAYRTLAQRLHPDHNPGDAVAEAAFKDVGEAYGVLSDPMRRAAHDRSLRSLLRASKGGFGGLVGVLEEIARDVMGARKQTGEGGRDLRYTLELDFEEAIAGGDRAIELATRDECKACRGVGHVQGAPCTACEGVGTVAARRSLSVTVPPATASGAKLRLPGQGEAGARGYQPGDLTVHVRVRPHPYLRVEDGILVVEVVVPMTLAALGGEVDVPLLDSSVRMRVPAGTQSGHVLRLGGKGITRGGKAGDAHVRLVVETPGELTNDTRQPLEALARAGDQPFPKVREFLRHVKERRGVRRAALALLVVCAGCARPGPAPFVDLSRHVSPAPRAELPVSTDEVPPATFTDVASEVHKGDVKAAQTALSRMSREDGGLARAEALVARLASFRQVAPRRVGILLPLSGAYRRLGAEARDAITLAARRFDTIELVFADTAGDASRAAAELERLVAEERVSLVVGPLGERESTRAAERAAQLGVPIAVLASSEGLAHAPSGVVSLATGDAELARAAAYYARVQGFSAPAVLHPRDDTGIALGDAFAAEAALQGTPVVQRGAYDPTGVTLEDDVEAFLNLDARTNERFRNHLRRTGGKVPFAPDVPFDVLFVPGDAESAALVASYLTYFHVELRTIAPPDVFTLQRKYGRIPQLVQLLGSAGWHHPVLMERGGEAVDGALVVDVFVGGPEAQVSWAGAAEFDEAFTRAFDRRPSRLAAEAFDGARLALRAWHRGHGEADPRQGIARALRTAAINRGPTGMGSIGADGALKRYPMLLRVDGGDFVIETLGYP